MTASFDDDVAIQAEGLGRVFDPFARGQTQSGAQVLRTLLRILGFRVNPAAGRIGVNREEVEALAGVDLRVRRGSAVCLQGPSRAGKSVLLRILSGALPPTAGRAVLRGQVSALLDLRQNVEGALSPLATIASRASSRRGAPIDPEAVIAFADLQGFEHVPASKLSSGMQLRLNLAVALAGDPEILLVDDVLGVGDIAFQEKCRRRLLAMKEAGATILFVSHDPAFVPALADRIVVLEAGRIVDDRPAGLFVPDADAPAIEIRTAEPDVRSEVARIDGCTLVLAGPDRIDVAMHFALAGAQRFRPVIDVVRDGETVFRSVAPAFEEAAGPGRVTARVTVPAGFLGRGEYWLEGSLVSLVGARVHVIKSAGLGHVRVNRGGASTPVRADLAWDVADLEREEAVA